MPPLRNVLAVVAASSCLVAACAAGTADTGREAVGAGGRAPSFVVLTPTADPSNSQTVSWRTRKAYGVQRVHVTPAAGGPEIVAAGVRKPATTVRNSGSATPQYTATITGLAPGTAYSYRIVTSGGTSPTYGFRTADADLTAPWTIVALGDTQIDNARVPARIVDRAIAANRSTPLILQAGDVVNHPWVKDEWTDLFRAMSPSRFNRNWAIAIGNHEQCILVKRCRSGNAEAFRSYFRWPRNGYPGQAGSWYFTDYPGVRIVVLNSLGSRIADQAAFLRKALAENPERFSIVVMHAGPFASRADRTNAAVRAHLLPVLEAEGADLVLAGHDHSYARGYLRPGGPVYVTSVSGPKFYSTSSKDWTRHGATRVKVARQVATYQTIQVTPEALVYRAVIGYKGSGASTPRAVGETIDTVTIPAR